MKNFIIRNVSTLLDFRIKNEMTREWSLKFRRTKISTFWSLNFGRSTNKQEEDIKLLRTKRNFFYLKTQFLPLSKHVPSLV